MSGVELGGNFIRARIEADREAGRHQQVVLRFPPEPNGWPHVGHAKSICLNFGLARDFGGRCHLRFDDTNPDAESVEFVEAILRDVKWLGFDWGEHLYYASDYYGRLYDWAVDFIRQGKAYVDELSDEQIREHRGTVTEPGKPSPYRDRPVAESLDLFARMKAGEFAEGSMVLRAKIDLASPNMKMRDPLMYRIKRAHHYRTGDTWCIYPFYDYAHCLSDAIEGITHSICTLEFENNRELYDWYLAQVALPCPVAPQQIEFARLELAGTITSKRKLKQLVEQGVVEGWDDPRMPTIAGLRARGIRPDAVRAFAERIGVAKANSVVDPALLEDAIRDDLNAEAPRVMGVLDPIEVVVDSWTGDAEWLDAPYWPHDVPKEGSRKVAFSRRLLIERDDFEADPPKGFKRLAPGREVRLRYGYLVTCTGYETGPDGRVARIHVTHDADSRGGDPKDGRKVGGTIHWVSADHAVHAEARLVDRLFTVAAPGAERDFLLDLNPDSMRIVTAALEPSMATAEPGSRWQLERKGYFYADPARSVLGRPVLVRIVGLKDGYRKAEASAPAPAPVASDKPASAGDKPQPRHPERAAALVTFGLDEDAARVITDDPTKDALFAAIRAAHPAPASVAKWLLNEILPAAGDRDVAGLPAENLGKLVARVDDGTLTAKLARQVLGEVLATGADPDAIIARDGLKPISDEGALRDVARTVIARHPDELGRYKAGNTRLIGFFVGNVLKETGGKADAKLLQSVVKSELDQL